MKDLEYTTNGLFTSLPQGEDAWRIMGGEKILTIHLSSVLTQLRKAGYSVGKAKKCTLSTDDILKELEE